MFPNEVRILAVAGTPVYGNAVIWGKQFMMPRATPLDSGPRRSVDMGDLWDSVALLKLPNIIVVPITHPGWSRHTKG